MTMQTYAAPAPSRQEFRNAREMLKHASTWEVLGRLGTPKEQPLNDTNSTMFRRAKVWKQKANGAPDIQPQDFAVQEGMTPTANTIGYENVHMTVRHWSVLFKLSSDAQLMHQEDIPSDMKQQTGETMAELKEKICWGKLRGGTGVIYQNGVSRNQVSTPISLTKLRLAARMIAAARGKMTASILGSSADFGTKPIEPGYICVGHTDNESDIRALPGFTPVAEYGSRKPISDHEIGSTERYRFMLSPVLDPFLGQGPAPGNTGMLATNGTNIDVYPLIVMAKDAWGHIALRGHGAVKPVFLPATEINHANPSGQFGYVGGNCRFNAELLNQNWVIRIECAVSSL